MGRTIDVERCFTCRVEASICNHHPPRLSDSNPGNGVAVDPWRPKRRKFRSMEDIEKRGRVESHNHG
jgi:hypothetical protein